MITRPKGINPRGALTTVFRPVAILRQESVEDHETILAERG
jgi:hypothetical protein